MPVFSVLDFTKNTTQILKASLEDEVVIDSDGVQYKILPMGKDGGKGKSPLEDIPRIKLNVTTQEIVGLLREGRAGPALG